MKEFAALFDAIAQSTKTTVKTDALAEYFQTAPTADRLWTIALFSGRRPKRVVATAKLRKWAAEVADTPLWLFEESSSIVGDLAETIALTRPPNDLDSEEALTFWINGLRALPQTSEVEQRFFVLDAWQRLGGSERFVFIKLVTGGFRLGISQKLMTRALRWRQDKSAQDANSLSDLKEMLNIYG